MDDNIWAQTGLNRTAEDPMPLDEYPLSPTMDYEMDTGEYDLLRPFEDEVTTREPGLSPASQDQ